MEDGGHFLSIVPVRQHEVHGESLGLQRTLGPQEECVRNFRIQVEVRGSSLVQL